MDWAEIIIGALVIANFAVLGLAVVVELEAENPSRPGWCSAEWFEPRR